MEIRVLKKVNTKIKRYSVLLHLIHGVVWLQKAQEKLYFDRMKSKIYKNGICWLIASQDLYLGQF